MALVIMLAMCKKEGSVFVSIECTYHVVDYRKKHAEFILGYFSIKVDKFDPKGSYPGCFYGVANVQKSGAIT